MSNLSHNAAQRPIVKLKVLDPRLGAEFPLPSYATDGSAGMDMRAMIHEPLTLEPGQAMYVQTGMAMRLADPGLVAMLFPRSGLGHKQGVVLGNSTGILDSDFTGEIGISLLNRTSQPVVINPGDRVAQMLVVPVVQVDWEIVDDLGDTARGAGGFGHTGVR